MSISQGPTIKDVILKQYELTDVYHDQKAHSAWIASTVYFAFAIGFITFWNPSSDSAMKIATTVICTTTYTAAMSFISLQFSHRWTAVIRTGMFHWLFVKKWSKIQNGSDYAKFQRQFDRREKRRQSKGITIKRSVFDIMWMTPLLPILLPIDTFFLAFLRRSVDQIQRDIECAKTMQNPDFRELKRLYRQQRRSVSGLIDTKYRTEIPSYSISLYLFAAQIILIWFPDVFSIAAKS